tara:strand:+ start:1599 stop:1835 length:237 start_codon:yes stop_codon:yes gene_type:complete
MERRVKKAHFQKVIKVEIGIVGMKMAFKNQKENTLMVIEKGYGNIGIQKVQKKKRLILLMEKKTVYQKDGILMEKKNI